MSGEATIFNILRIITLWLAPVVMIIGSLLLVLTSGAYSSLEEKLGREVGGIKRRIIPVLETNINSMHQWVLARKNIFGGFFIACSLLILLLLRK